MIIPAEIAKLEKSIIEFGEAIIANTVETLATMAREEARGWPKDMDEYLDLGDYNFARGCRYACDAIAESIEEWGNKEHPK